MNVAPTPHRVIRRLDIYAITDFREQAAQYLPFFASASGE